MIKFTGWEEEGLETIERNERRFPIPMSMWMSDPIVPRLAPDWSYVSAHHSNSPSTAWQYIYTRTERRKLQGRTRTSLSCSEEKICSHRIGLAPFSLFSLFTPFVKSAKIATIYFFVLLSKSRLSLFQVTSLSINHQRIRRHHLWWQYERSELLSSFPDHHFDPNIIKW